MVFAPLQSALGQDTRMFRPLLIALLLLIPTLVRAQAPVLVQPGTVTFGLSATFPPFEFIDNGNPAGFDIDLAKLLTKKMSLGITITTYEFKGLLPALLGKRIDAIISGMYINAERSQVADFVPYMLVGNQFVVRKGNPVGLSDQMSLCGHRISVPVGTVFEIEANKIDAACQAANKARVSILSLGAGTTTAALALAQDRADAIIVSTATATSLIKTAPDAYETAGLPFDIDTKVGIAVNKDNPALLAALDKALHELVTDGSYAALLQQWQLPTGSSAF
jgi:polar amino acid transport system substrate-binding protein